MHRHALMQERNGDANIVKPTIVLTGIMNHVESNEISVLGMLIAADTCVLADSVVAAGAVANEGFWSAEGSVERLEAVDTAGEQTGGVQAVKRSLWHRDLSTLSQGRTFQSMLAQAYQQGGCLQFDGRQVVWSYTDQVCKTCHADDANTAHIFSCTRQSGSVSGLICSDVI